MNSSLKHHWVAVIVTTLVTFGVSVVLTVVQPMEYRSAFTVLAIDQNPNLDGYAAAKSQERLSSSLSTTIATTAFADQIYQQLKDRPELQGNVIVSSDIQTRRKAWKKEVVATAVPSVGQVKVAVYQRDPSQAGIISNAVAIGVTAYGTDYLGGGKYVVLKMVDTPLTSSSPVRPNVFANLAVGLIVGFGGSIAYFLLFTGAAAMPMLYAPMYPTMLPPMAPTSRPESGWPSDVVEQSQPGTSKRRRRQPENGAWPSGHPSHTPQTVPATPSPMTSHHRQPENAGDPSEHGRSASHSPTATLHVAGENKAVSPANLPISDEWVMP